MPTIDTVLVAIADPMDRTHPLIARAVEISAALQAKVVLFHSHFDAALSGHPFRSSVKLAALRGERVAELTAALERVADQFRRRNLATEALVSWEEPVHESIVRAAIRCDAQLVIAGEHRRRGERLASWSLTDWELLRLCPRPLLLVRSRRSRAGSAVLAALDPTHAADKPASLDKALAEYAGLFASAFEVDLHAVHCIPPIAPMEANDDAHRRAHEKLAARMRSTLKKARATPAQIHVIDAPVTTAVPKLAEQLPAQILAIGAISRRGIQRLAIGNTAERVIYNSPCDLLIVKPPGFKPRLGRARARAVK